MRAEPRRAPTATYRLQLSARFTFDDAVAALDHLAELGVSHVYCSPLLAARPGSGHGYDVVDPTRVNPELGGEAGRARLLAALRARGMGLVVDVVPNHLAVSHPQLTPLWWAALAEGPASPAGRVFDLDPGPDGRVALPVLAEESDLERLSLDGEALVLGDRRWPLATGTAGGTPAQVHARQHYRLTGWRSSAVGYRRFFDIDDLAAVRVEDPQVFAATHALVLSWAAAGEVDGVRCDHVDGLADPGGYLRRLAEAAPGAWLVVEKILGAGEELPDWPVAGTTGYEAARVVDGVFLDPAGEAPLTELYTGLTGRRASWAEVAHAAKLAAARGGLAPEVDRLARLGADPEALREVLAAFPVYRTYLPEGAAHLQAALDAARARRADLAGAIESLAPRLADPADPLAVRFQQTSGAVVAKGVEDTAMYRYLRLLCHNEVGGDPGHFAVSPEEFHAFCLAREQRWPAAMTTVTTHDTKRSADVRLRLALLSEVPAAWAEAVRDFEAAAAGLTGTVDVATRYLLHQTVVGAWPLGPQRLAGYLRKAAREAGERTGWVDPDPVFEADLDRLASAVLADAGYRAALAGLLEVLGPAERPSLAARTLLHLAMPGVPDIYQGDEVECRRLVDPDNREPLDLSATRARADAKTAVIAAVVGARRRGLLAPGSGYAPWPVPSPHALAFTRGPGVLAVAGRLLTGLARAGGWGEATLALPPGRWVDALAGTPARGEVLLRTLLAGGAALLVRTDR